MAARSSSRNTSGSCTAKSSTTNHDAATCSPPQPAFERVHGSQNARNQCNS
eukprot:NODE_29548_length_443_cov_2.661392.p3 GENE.NODE_29548_length_443_cov_2.661392~~NODE_29548_length_443_cov_2.661392.p3  ORF type:complete len:51 (+),score=10.15 NODE_29548_length_443_cov_2.661392:227-379(+)